MVEKILVVDDNFHLREIAKTILAKQGYQVTVAEDGKQALEIFKKISLDLIVSDIAMPEMDGFGLLEAVRSHKKGASIPFLFLSAYSRRIDLTQALHLGVNDYLVKPFDAQELLDAVRLQLDQRRAVQLFDTHEAHMQTVLLMANLVEARDPHTRKHIDRVREIALRFGKALQWDQNALVALEFGAILHDIGKIVVPTEILNKSGEFTPSEWEIIRQHPEAGAKMLKGVTHLQLAEPFILFHHEKWDGSGYPFGLHGGNIPIEGRMMAIADVYDAMTSERPYHKALSKTGALDFISECSGTHFDPKLVTVFLRLASELP